jgi:hypothetical protein
VVNTAVQAAGIKPLQGHGIWIGSTLHYLLQGISFEAMKAKGRWTSDAFSVYITRHAEVLAQHTNLGTNITTLSNQAIAPHLHHH